MSFFRIKLYFKIFVYKFLVLFEGIEFFRDGLIGIIFFSGFLSVV